MSHNPSKKMKIHDECKSDHNDNMMNNDQSSNSNSNPTSSCHKRKYEEIFASPQPVSVSFNANEQQQKNVESRISHKRKINKIDIDHDCKTNSNTTKDNVASKPKEPSTSCKRRRVFGELRYMRVDEDDCRCTYPSFESVDSDHQNVSSPELSASPETPEPMAPNHIQQQMNINQMNHQKVAPKGDVAMTSIVIDYDDTIYPTSAILQIFFGRKPAMKHASTFSSIGLLSRISWRELIQLEQLSFITYQMLRWYISQYGNENIFIVSAASKEWIRHSLEILYNIGAYSAIYTLLFLNPPTMIDIYTPSQRQLPFQNINDITQWKLDTFKKLLNNNIKSSYHGFVSIGDGEFEYKAAKTLRDDQQGEKTLIHCVKFKCCPQINDLIAQQWHLTYLCGIYEIYTLGNKEQIEVNYDNYC